MKDFKKHIETILWNLGFEPVTKDGHYQTYQSNGISFGKSYKSTRYEKTTCKGQRIIKINTEDPEFIFMGIEEDGGTRNVFHGIIRNPEELKTILNCVA